MKGGVEIYQDGISWDVEAIYNLISSGLKPRFEIKWAGYDTTFNTLESEDAIADKDLVRDFLAKISRHDCTQELLYQMRDTVAAAILAQRMPEGEYDVVVEGGALAPAARALLEWLASPPSRMGKEPIRSTVVVSATSQTTTLKYSIISDIDWVLSLHTVREGRAYGALIHKRGGAGSHDMAFVGPLLIIRCASTAPVRIDFADSRAPSTGSLSRFHEKTGSPPSGSRHSTSSSTCTASWVATAR